MMASLTKSCIKKKKRGTALIDGGTKTKRPTLGGMFDTLIKRCKLSDFTNSKLTFILKNMYLTQPFPVNF